MVDLGGSLAVASRGLFATGVSTDLNGMLRCIRLQIVSRSNSIFLVTYLNSGGKVGDVLKAVVTCDKCKCLLMLSVGRILLISSNSWEDNGIHFNTLYKQQRRASCKRKSYEVSSMEIEAMRILASTFRAPLAPIQNSRSLLTTIQIYCPCVETPPEYRRRAFTKAIIPASNTFEGMG